MPLARRVVVTAMHAKAGLLAVGLVLIALKGELNVGHLAFQRVDLDVVKFELLEKPIAVRALARQPVGMLDQHNVN